MLLFFDLSVPKSEFVKSNCRIPTGYIRLSDHFYFKGSPIVVQQDLNEDGSWTYRKGIGSNGLPNKNCVHEKGDMREGVSAITGNYEWQIFNGSQWILVDSLSSSSVIVQDPDDASCVIWVPQGSTINTIGVKRECATLGTIETYVRVDNTGDPNTDWAPQTSR